jgi:hypothetical protein
MQINLDTWLPDLIQQAPMPLRHPFLPQVRLLLIAAHSCAMPRIAILTAR